MIPVIMLNSFIGRQLPEASIIGYQNLHLATAKDSSVTSSVRISHYNLWIISERDSGWTSVLGWQTGLASLAFLAGTMIQGLLVLDNPDYVFKNWHGTLLVIAITAFCIIFNTFLAKKLPMVEKMVLMFHLLGFFAVLIPLWALAPKSSASDVFTQFTNLGGWSTTGLAFMVGLLSPVYTLIGADSAVHMSEEIKDASIVLPRAIIWAASLNGTLGFIMVITFCFTLGNLEDILSTPTGYPFIQVFYNVTNSNAGTSVMTAILIVNITSACISTVATTSRQTWSFARDKGLPFSSFVSHVSAQSIVNLSSASRSLFAVWSFHIDLYFMQVKPGWNIPLNAVLITFTITCLLSLINIGSTVAFNAIGSLAVSALLATYIISFTCLILKRVRGEPLPPRRWNLGQFGIFVNIGAVIFLLIVWVFIFFPVSTPVTPTTMNWNVVMFCGTMIFAVIYYVIFGRKTYTSPVELVKRT
jgi:amino acid transporter